MKEALQIIKELRHELNMNQNEFAKHVGISVRTIQDWESGRRIPPDYIPRLLSYQIGYEKICQSYKVLIVFFEGTSAETLVENTIFDTVSLPSDKEKDVEILLDAMRSKNYEYVICFGQKPGISDTVKIEKEAHGEINLTTSVDCNQLKSIFEQNGITASVSSNPGNSYCNNVYWVGLNYIKDDDRKARIVFVHVPYENKISDLVDMGQRINATVNQWILINK